MPRTRIAKATFELVAKFMGNLWSAAIGHSPLDVVAWHGNYAPYKYDLRRFNAIGSISYDHPDPSIFLVLQSQSDTPGVDTIDFVIFPPRILAMEHTFRPPWFHRNVASEFMGLIHGVYDAKAEGFLPGGASLHNCMTGHGPDAETFEKASAADLSQPTRITDTMAFMFETRQVIRPTRAALESAQLQPEYFRCWQGLRKHFDPPSRRLDSQLASSLQMPGTAMTYENILVETRDRVGLIRLNRPQRMNALNDALAKELSAALHAFDDDDGIGCIVITGNEKAFAAGADIGAMAEWDYAKVYGDDYITRDWEEILRIRKPVIAAVAGLRAGRRLRAGDGVRHDHRGRHGEVRPAGDHDRHDAGHGRHATAAARDRQGEGDGLVPDRPHGRRRRSRARRPGRARRAGGKLEEEALAFAAKIASFSLPVVLKIKEAINRAYEIVAGRRPAVRAARVPRDVRAGGPEGRHARVRREAQAGVQAQVARRRHAPRCAPLGKLRLMDRLLQDIVVARPAAGVVQITLHRPDSATRCARRRSPSSRPSSRRLSPIRKRAPSF